MPMGAGSLVVRPGSPGFGPVVAPPEDEGSLFAALSDYRLDWSCPGPTGEPPVRTDPRRKYGDGQYATYDGWF